jgi:hypothetical protein
LLVAYVDCCRRIDGESSEDPVQEKLTHNPKSKQNISQQPFTRVAMLARYGDPITILSARTSSKLRAVFPCARVDWVRAVGLWWCPERRAADSISFSSRNRGSRVFFSYSLRSGRTLSACERGDSNPHGLLHWILSPARLPIPPLPRSRFKIAVRAHRTKPKKAPAILQGLFVPRRSGYPPICRFTILGACSGSPSWKTLRLT